MNQPRKPLPTYLAQRRMEHGRLTYYLDAADADYWDNIWKQHLSETYYVEAAQGYMNPGLQRVMLQYLPREGRIVEAGCGPATYVLGLRVHGYDAEGVDWAEQTVQLVQSIRPDIPVRVGDVTDLNVPNDYYSGYISLGVMEHRYEGPEPFLKEAHRILKPGGIAIISVPYINPLRRLKARLGLYRGNPEGLSFYQYAYSREEFCGLLTASGFEVIDTVLRSGYKGVKDEIPLLRAMFEWPLIGKRIQRWLLNWQVAERRLGHMLVTISRKRV